MKHISYKITLNRVAVGISSSRKDDRIFYSQRIALERVKSNNLLIYEHDAEGKLARVTFAKSAEWTPTQWQLTDGYIRHFEGGVEVGYEAFDTHAIERHEDPARFIGSEKDPRAMTIEELRQQIAYKQDAGQISRKEQVKLYHKTAYPFARCCCCYAGGSYRYPFW